MIADWKEFVSDVMNYAQNGKLPEGGDGDTLLVISTIAEYSNDIIGTAVASLLVDYIDMERIYIRPSDGKTTLLIRAPYRDVVRYTVEGIRENPYIQKIVKLAEVIEGNDLKKYTTKRVFDGMVMNDDEILKKYREAAKAAGIRTKKGRLVGGDDAIAILEKYTKGLTELVNLLESDEDYERIVPMVTAMANAPTGVRTISEKLPVLRKILEIAREVGGFVDADIPIINGNSYAAITNFVKYYDYIFGRGKKPDKVRVPAGYDIALQFAKMVDGNTDAMTKGKALFFENRKYPVEQFFIAIGALMVNYKEPAIGKAILNNNDAGDFLVYTRSTRFIPFALYEVIQNVLVHNAYKVFKVVEDDMGNTTVKEGSKWYMWAKSVTKENVLHYYVMDILSDMHLLLKYLSGEDMSDVDYTRAEILYRTLLGVLTEGEIEGLKEILGNFLRGDLRGLYFDLLLKVGTPRIPQRILSSTLIDNIYAYHALIGRNIAKMDPVRAIDLLQWDLSRFQRFERGDKICDDIVNFIRKNRPRSWVGINGETVIGVDPDAAAELVRAQKLVYLES